MTLAKRLLLTALPLMLLACAAPPLVTHKLEVNVASVERLSSETLESRLNARVRVRNPNDVAVEYSGAFVELFLQGKSVGSGVMDTRGSLPRYGEVMLNIPITVSDLIAIQQARGLYGSADRPLDYVLRGRLQGVDVASQQFQWQGALVIPTPR